MSPSPLWRRLYEGEKREEAKRLEALVLAEVDEEGTAANDASGIQSPTSTPLMGAPGIEPGTSRV